MAKVNLRHFEGHEPSQKDRIGHPMSAITKISNYNEKSDTYLINQTR